MSKIARIPLRLTAFVAAGILPAMAAASDQVKVTGGVLEGTVGSDPSVRVFRGVPFAAPPVGDLRWKAPQAVAAWKGVRKADEWGTRCMQGPMFGPLRSREKAMGEDCLYLNVWTTAKTEKEKRPVLVVFHGGGFAAGSASEPRTDGEWFARQGIVVVEANHRLGVFGFLAHPELSKESAGRGSGNYGMLDQTAALEWTRANVAAFGGDPGNVTVNGESAGSLSVSALMASPLTKHLVHKAIGQSGAFFASPTGGLAEKPLADKEQDGIKFAASVGAGSLADLRAKTADDLLAAVMKTGGWGYSPGIDGYFLTEKVAATYAAGKQAKIPLLAGWTSSEMGMAIAMNPEKPTAASFAEQAKKQFGERAKDALVVYPAANDAEVLQTAADLASDLFISYSRRDNAQGRITQLVEVRVEAIAENPALLECERESLGQGVAQLRGGLCILVKKQRFDGRDAHVTRRVYRASLTRPLELVFISEPLTHRRAHARSARPQRKHARTRGTQRGATERLVGVYRLVLAKAIEVEDHGAWNDGDVVPIRIVVAAREEFGGHSARRFESVDRSARQANRVHPAFALREHGSRGPAAHVGDAGGTVRKMKHGATRRAFGVLRHPDLETGKVELQRGSCKRGHRFENRAVVGYYLLVGRHAWVIITPRMAPRSTASKTLLPKHYRNSTMRRVSVKSRVLSR
jgi:para-nitrobenzyl esterase